MKTSLSLFGSYHPAAKPLATRTLLVELATPGWSSGVMAEAAVSAEELFIAAPATARFEFRGATLACRVTVAAERGAPWNLDVAWRPGPRLARAFTELSGTLRGPGGEPSYDVRLRVDWRRIVGRR